SVICQVRTEFPIERSFTLSPALSSMERVKHWHRLGARGQQMLASLVIFFAALSGPFQVRGQAITADINVKLQPLLEHIDVVTDINIVGNSLFVCTQPGQLYRKNLSATTPAEVFLDLRSEVGRLGSNIPGLPGLGYPVPETYDERGLLGFAADPQFDRNG